MRVLLFCLLTCGLTAPIGAPQQGVPEAPSSGPAGPVMILNGDFPDPSIVRDGEDFYLTHSSFDYVPGMLIWHSKDLQHWTRIARALRRSVGNIWAPDLIKYKDLFYIYFPAGGTNWVITAKTPYGPWSDPVDLKLRGIDPGHIATPEGRRYLHVSGGQMVELAPDGLSVAGSLQKTYSGWKYPEDWLASCFCLESPKLAFHNGYYYLTSAQGGTVGPSTSHMAVSARSKSPAGPWEDSPYNPVVRTWNRQEQWWMKGHATLLDGGRGRWYLVYHAYENGHLNMGRHTLVEPVEWTSDGWFKPLYAPGKTPVTAEIRNHRIAADDFSKPDLDLQWQFSGIASTEEFSAGGGAVTVKAEPGKFKVLHTQAADHNYEASVKIEGAPGTEAGLILFYSPEVNAGVGSSGGQLFMLRRGRPMSPQVPCPDCRYLKIRLVEDELSAFYSKDGVAWKQMPNAVEVSGYQTNVLGDFSSIRPGVYMKGSGQVRIQDFRYRALPAR